MNEARRRLGLGGIGLCLIGTGFWAVALIVAPHLIMIDVSLRPALTLSEMGGPKDHWQLANYLDLVLDPLSRGVFFKTIWASILITLVSLAVCYPVAFYLAKLASGGALRVLMLLLIVPFWINEILRTFAWQLLLAQKGLINAALLGLGLIPDPIAFTRGHTGVLIGMTYAYILFMVFPMYSAMESLDRNQIEAARDLGASWWRIHRCIVIPHAKPGIASGCIVTFMLAAGSFAVPQILGGVDSLWFTQLIYNRFNVSDWNQGAAYAVGLEILCLLFVLAMMRLFRVGLSDIAR
ncbi:MAG: ABC transporter permease [Alphaproteobacteria bacterium]